MRRQHRRSTAIATAGLCALSLSGCVQMTRHSNTLVFGTNTSFGIVVGTDATSTPSIAVGYKRQEAVVMPLVANVKSDGELLAPCLIGPADGDPHGAAAVGTAATHPCLLVGRDGDGKTDAYSVLASFGTKYEAGTQGVGGSIAQYFATGVAAQHLALSGGAAVATGGAAAVAANPANVALREAVKKAAENGSISAKVKTLGEVIGALADAIVAQPQATLDAKLTAIDGRLKTALQPLCTGLAPADCAAKVRTGGGGLLSKDPAAIAQEADTLRGQ